MKRFFVAALMITAIATAAADNQVNEQRRVGIVQNTNAISYTLEYSQQKEPVVHILFAHGLGGTGYQVKGFEHSFPQGVTQHIYAPHGPEVEVKDASFFIHANRVSLGQEADIAIIKKQIDAIDGDIIAYGISKGAATWINTMAALSPEQIKKIKAVVLDSPFADIEEVARNRVLLDIVDIADTLKTTVVPYLLKKCFFKAYDPMGAKPIVSINNMPNIPVFLIHSDADELIHVSHSQRLYKALKSQAARTAPTYYLELQGLGAVQGSHIGHFACKLDELQSFYRSLYYVGPQSDTAEMTPAQEKLAHCQPSIDEIDARMDQHQWSLRSLIGKVLPTSVLLGCSAAGIKYLRR